MLGFLLGVATGVAIMVAWTAYHVLVRINRDDPA